jgi:hypothetical protein
MTRTDLRVGRIQDKTRWAKALGGAATIVNGYCKEDICQSKQRTAVGHERPEYVFIEVFLKKEAGGVLKHLPASILQRGGVPVVVLLDKESQPLICATPLFAEKLFWQVTPEPDSLLMPANALA